jgi:SAM-dependent methyltransferase
MAEITTNGQILSKYPRPLRLNFGSGQYKKEGFVNIDIDQKTNPDVVYNLNDLPYPLEDNSCSRIEADHVLEHLQNPFDVLIELHRVLQPGGELLVRVPHFSRGFTHPDHKRGFDVSFPLYFNPKFKGGFTGTIFKCTRMRLIWFSQPYLKRVTLSAAQYWGGLILGTVFSLLANLSPYMCSRLWCFWVGGFEEIEFHFEKTD